jgi:ELWxxDGT repeat protein/VCBS repeat-containing protein
MEQSLRATSRRSIAAALLCAATLAGVLIGAVATPAGAAAPESLVLVKNINTGTASSNPSNLVNINGTLFFTATDGTGVGGHGTELWKSDGTAAGTVLVKDINVTASGSGTANAAPANLRNFNGTLFFTATDGTVAGVGHGTELWKSDGTAAGTQLVTDIAATGTASASPSNLLVTGSMMYFAANDGAGIALWKTDGTASGTAIVKTIASGGPSSPGNLYFANGLLYFRGTLSGDGIEPWVTDGTPAGTVELANINAGSANSLPLEFNLFNGFVYFSASDGTVSGVGHGLELWRTDGTPGGTVLFDDIFPGTTSGNPGSLIVYNGLLYFGANTPNSLGNELFTTDGTVANTLMVKDINPGAASGVPQSFVISNNILYFMGTTAIEAQELWRTDGTAAGTVMVKDLRSGTSGANGIQTSFSNATLNGTMYFDGGAFDHILYKTDGTAAGTVQVPGTFQSFPGIMVPFNGTIFMQAFTSAVGTELFRLNTGPTAVADSYTTNEDTTLAPGAPGLLANDTDPDGNMNTLAAVKVTDPAHGSVAVNADGSFSYVPAANYNGPDSFTYKANDGSLDSSPPSTVSITVTAVNDAPVANNDAYSTNEDTALTVSGPGVLGNDTDADSDPLTAGSASTPANGSVTLNADGSFTYTPNANFSGSDSFTYKANDGSADSNVAAVTITVNAVNDAPVANNDAYSTNEDTPLSVAAPGVLGNDTDVDSTLTATSASTPANGSVSLNADGSFTYTPNANFNGSDSFTYVADDGSGGTSTATVTIGVSSVNDTPVANNDAYSTNEDTALTVSAPGVLGNDTDADGTLTATSPSTPNNGSLVLNPNGSFTYTPDANFNGSDSFTYVADDGTGGTATATVNLTVTAVNDAPVATNDAYSTNEDTPLTLVAPWVLGNDTDADADTLTAGSASTPANGSVALNADGSFTYTPNANFNGSDAFTYVASDGNGGTSVATVSIAVSPVNDAPVANADSYGPIAANTPFAVSAPGVLGNDTDADADTLSAGSASTPANGSVTLNANGSFTYTPNFGFGGSDSFTYVASDGNGGTSTATASITVTSPTGPTTLAISDVTLNEGDAGTSPATFTILRSGSNSGTSTVKYRTVNVTATGGSDFSAVALTPLSFAPGEATKTVTVAITGDTAYEKNETFKVVLSAPTGATLSDGTGIGTIVNDDPTAYLGVNDVSLTEGVASTTTTATFTVTRSGNTSGAASVKVRTTNGTATAASGDYVAVPLTTVNFADGQATATVNVTVNGDNTHEKNETFKLAISSPVGAVIADAAGLGTIVTDD